MLSLARERLRLRPMGGAVPLPAPDGWLLVVTGALLALGLLMVTSASMPMAERETGQVYYYAYRQAAYVMLGLVMALAAYQVPVRTWLRLGPQLLIVAILLLILVLVPGIGKEVNGSSRWIRLGIMNVQVSEIAKLAAIVYVAGYLHRQADRISRSLLASLRPLIVLGFAAMLLLLEPDFGATAVIMAVAVGMIFLAGVNPWKFLAVQGVMGLIAAAILYAAPYRRARLSSFLDPWADPYNSGFQLTQSLMAIGRGELTGVGLGASVQKLHYLPEAHTDFVFAVTAEELGLVGVLVLGLLYGVLVVRGFAVGARAERLQQPFGAWLAYGVALWFALQALVNMGVNMGALPTKGLTLPLVSYGGSSLIMMLVAIALLLRVDAETRQLDPLLRPGAAP